MNRKLVEREAGQELTTAHPEVEFALVLARTIDAMHADPQQLRSAIYELARHKLNEQFTGQDAAEVARLSAALEVAIQGVEAHLEKNDDLIAAPRSLGIDRPARVADPYYTAARAIEPPRLESLADENRMERGTWPRTTSDSGARPMSRLKWVGVGKPLRIVFLLAVMLAAGFAILQRTGQFQILGRKPETAVSQVQPSTPAPEAPAPVETSLPKPDPLLPTTYGIYAISGGKLYELEPLQGRAPDIRVAVSAVITAASQTRLPDGNLRFVVFRRDGAGSVPDQLDVRVVAKIEQAMTFDASGKPVLSKADENWVIRNISYPYRTAPVKDRPEMYEIQSKAADSVLLPGRYALIVKGQSFDFTVEGEISDPRQCLQRLAAQNGTFYSACQKSP
jgi:hypothetical protein